MIVLDASAVVHLLLGTEVHTGFLRTSLADPHWVVPEHFVLEVASGLRGAWMGRDIDDTEFDTVLDVLAGLPLDVWPTRPLLPRIRQLAHDATTYDAAYLALAEELRVALVTTDAILAAAPGVHCQIVQP